MAFIYKVLLVVALAFVSPSVCVPWVKIVKQIDGWRDLNSNPLWNLSDSIQLQDVSVLDRLAEMSKSTIDGMSEWFSLSNPLANLSDIMELQDTSVLEHLAEMSKTNENSIIDGTYSTRMEFRPLCPDSVLEFRGREDVKFILYNKNNPQGVDISKRIREGMLVKNAPIKFVIHGFLNGGNSLMPITVKDAYMQNSEDYNVIVVDWSKGSGAWLSNYFICLITSRVVPMVGEAVGDFILDLIHQQNVNILYVNLIGHSLGAQISGFVGKHLIKNGYKLPIIVGLDAAHPGFSDLDESERLCPTDAEYVEAIHTNCGELGFETPIGDADYYPNHHRFIERMPGCITASCSHAMSFKYFAETIKYPYGFEAKRCNNFDKLKEGECNGPKAFMGGNDMRVGKLPGIFRLETKRNEPYGLSTQ